MWGHPKLETRRVHVCVLQAQDFSAVPENFPPPDDNKVHEGINNFSTCLELKGMGLRARHPFCKRKTVSLLTSLSCDIKTNHKQPPPLL